MQESKKMKWIYRVAVVLLSVSSCQKEVITIGTGVSETFYVENAGSIDACTG